MAMPKAEVRSEGAESPKFYGTAVVFDKWAQIGAPEWGFRERVAEGALTKTLRESDVFFLDWHDGHKVISRTSAGTLQLSVDSRGLDVESAMDTRVSYVNDVVANVENGNYTGMSFGFQVTKDEWTRGADGADERTIREMALFEVSAVGMPAYTDTDAAIRSAVLTAKIQRGDLTEAEVRSIRGTGVDRADRLVRGLRRVVEQRMSANDTFAALSEAVADSYGNGNRWASVEDYDDNFVYFTVYDWTDNDSDMYRQGYTLAADGMATLTGTAEQVRRRSNYTVVNDPDDSGEPLESTRSSDMTEPPHGTRAGVATLRLRMRALQALHGDL